MKEKKKMSRARKIIRMAVILVLVGAALFLSLKYMYIIKHV